MDPKYDYSWRVKPRTPAGKTFAVSFFVLWIILIFFPFNIFGQQPVFGWIPACWAAVLVVQVIYLAVWAVFMVEKSHGK